MQSNSNLNWDSFSHGQIQSKIWLCEQLEPYIPKKARTAILGSWYNVMGFMLLTRQPDLYQLIVGVDIDPAVKPIAEKINNGWIVEKNIIKNITSDVNDFNLQSFNLVINCSPEHMENNQWFKNIVPGTTVCIQSSNVVVGDDEVWKCVNPNRSLEELTAKYPLSTHLFSDTKEIRYDDSGYDRFMLIGIK
jgi:hypothetical protein